MTALINRDGKISAETLATGLGWFSLALGAAELFAPRMLTRALGMEGSETLVRAYGAREMAAGIGILASRDPTPWVWGRVAGDALDLGTLAFHVGGDNPRRGAVMGAIAAVAGVAALDVLCAQSLSSAPEQPDAARLADYRTRSGFPNGRPARAANGDGSDAIDYSIEVTERFETERQNEAMRLDG